MAALALGVASVGVMSTGAMASSLSTITRSDWGFFDDAPHAQAIAGDPTYVNSSATSNIQASGDAAKMDTYVLNTYGSTFWSLKADVDALHSYEISLNTQLNNVVLRLFANKAQHKTLKGETTGVGPNDVFDLAKIKTCTDFYVNMLTGNAIKALPLIPGTQGLIAKRGEKYYHLFQTTIAETTNNKSFLDLFTMITFKAADNKLSKDDGSEDPSSDPSIYSIKSKAEEEFAKKYPTPTSVAPEAGIWFTLAKEELIQKPLSQKIDAIANEALSTLSGSPVTADIKKGVTNVVSWILDHGISLATDDDAKNFVKFLDLSDTQRDTAISTVTNTNPPGPGTMVQKYKDRVNFFVKQFNSMLSQTDKAGDVLKTELDKALAIPAAPAPAVSGIPVSGSLSGSVVASGSKFDSLDPAIKDIYTRMGVTSDMELAGLALELQDPKVVAEMETANYINENAVQPAVELDVLKDYRGKLPPAVTVKRVDAAVRNGGFDPGTTFKGAANQMKGKYEGRVRALEMIRRGVDPQELRDYAAD